jgi:DNA processing protein
MAKDSPPPSGFHGVPLLPSTPPSLCRERHTELAHWLRLLHTPGLGPRRIARLLEIHGSPEQVLLTEDQEWKVVPAPGQPPLPADWSAHRESGVAADLAWQAQDPGQRHLLTRTDPEYPLLLRQLPDAPPVLYLVGQLSLLHRPQIAIVGTREPTPQGERHAEYFARELASAGVAVTSGLARGIDAAAHRGALATPEGRTLAVMATGPDRIYPRRHARLAQEIAEQGLLVALWPVGSAAQASHFPQRNRVISGLTLGTLVVEAALHSGSLITARLAAEQGRNVYALPGSILNPVSRGCHRLLREGAQLVESPDDILEDLAAGLDLGIQHPSSPATAELPLASTVQPVALPAAQVHVLELMGYDPIGEEELLTRSGLTVAALSSILVLLELDGYVARLHHRRYQRLDAGSLRR